MAYCHQICLLPFQYLLCKPLYFLGPSLKCPSCNTVKHCFNSILHLSQAILRPLINFLIYLRNLIFNLFVIFIFVIIIIIIFINFANHFLFAIIELKFYYFINLCFIASLLLSRLCIDRAAFYLVIRYLPFKNKPEGFFIILLCLHY